MTRDDLVLEKIASVIAEASYMEEMEKVAEFTKAQEAIANKMRNSHDAYMAFNSPEYAKQLRKMKVGRNIKRGLAGLGAAGILTGGAQINKRVQAKRSAKAAQAAIDAKPINRILSRAKGLGSKAEKYISRVPKKYRALATVGIGGAAGFGGYEALKNRGNE